jgi:1,3,6,8-tetrahydroxynaphthalene synthase
LTEYGNIASVVVLDSLGRMFADDRLVDGARGVIAGFGPGITAEMSVGSWRTKDGR